MIATANTVSTTTTVSTGTSTNYGGFTYTSSTPQIIASNSIIDIDSNRIKIKGKPILEDIHECIEIKDINVYGHDKPRVVEVIFYYDNNDVKVRAICDEEDIFDLETGVYICISKLLFSKILTVSGIEQKASEISLYKENAKLVNKAIKKYYKKLKDKEEEKKKKEEEKRAKKNHKEKNEAKKKKRKERNKDELMKLIKEALGD